MVRSDAEHRVSNHETGNIAAASPFETRAFALRA